MTDDGRVSLTEEEKTEVVAMAKKMANDVRAELMGMEKDTPAYELAMVEVISLGRLIEDPEDRRHLDGAADARMMRTMMGWPPP